MKINSYFWALPGDRWWLGVSPKIPPRVLDRLLVLVPGWRFR